MFWEKNAKFGKFFFSFSTILHNTDRNRKNKAELPKQCFCHKIRFKSRKLQKNGTFRTGLHLPINNSVYSYHHDFVEIYLGNPCIKNIQVG